jgi:TnpA family transposase
MARLRILSLDEIKSLYQIPKLESEERQFVFELDEEDKDYINTIDNVAAKINYILNLGYFRTSGYFFSFSFQSVKEDVKFIIKTYFPGSKFPMKQISQRQHYINRDVVLKKHGMALYSKESQNNLSTYLKALVKQHSVPKYLFDSLLEYCYKNKVVRPRYTTLQDLVSESLANERNRISNKLYTLIDHSLRNSLNNLLKKDDLFYQLTLVKKDQKNFTTSEIRATVAKNKLLADIYKRSVEIIKQLDISEQNVLYYAEIARQYTVYGLRNLKQLNLMRLYLLCYVYHRFLKVNDHLVASFVYRVNGYIDEAEVFQKEAIYQAQVTDKENRGLAADILSLHINKKVADHEIRDKSFVIMPKNKFRQFIQKLKKPHLNPDYYRWHYYKNSAYAIKQNIRPCFKALDFQSKSVELSKAINFMKSHFESNKSFSEYKFEDIPTEFIDKKMKRHVILKIKTKNSSKKTKSINGDAYEFMIYSYIDRYLKSGTVTIKDSLSYRALDDELLAKAYWQSDRDNILASLATQLISTNISEILNNFEIIISKRYHEVNQRINSKNNDKIKVKYDKKGNFIDWKLPYKKSDDGVNNPYYDGMSTVAISQIIKMTNHHTDFMKHFTHILPSYSKTRADESSLAACIVAKATGSDIYHMKDISDIKESSLTSHYNNFIRFKTLTLASDEVINKTAKLSIFNEYTLADYGIHASVDGQKLETKYNTIKARYSSKYYGFGQGVSAYTLFANCVPLCTKIIGANEHESHYLLDILKSNTSDVEVFAVSGDMHSINRVNFILLYIFGYRFMPRFTHLDQKAQKNMVSFENPDNFKDYIIKPSSQINKALIMKEADNILRIFATLALKENSQSNIVRKLSSYQSNDTLRALIELDKIVMSLYMLDYIDDEEMRKNVHRSLNRGESYHQLRSAIAKVSGRKLIGKNEIELIINNECARLLALCIIFYNAYLLSKIFDYCRAKHLKAESDKIIRLSPVAWQHINLIGQYNFTSEVVLPDLDSVMEQLISNLSKVVLVVKTSKEKSKVSKNI